MDGVDESSIATLTIVQYVPRRKNVCFYHAPPFATLFLIMDSLGGARISAYFFLLYNWFVYWSLGLSSITRFICSSWYFSLAAGLQTHLG